MDEELACSPVNTEPHAGAPPLSRTCDAALVRTAFVLAYFPKGNEPGGINRPTRPLLRRLAIYTGTGYV